MAFRDLGRLSSTWRIVGVRKEAWRVERENGMGSIFVSAIGI